MIQAKPTEKLTGVTIQGDYDDFYQLTEAIHNVAVFEMTPNDPYYAVTYRTLGACYEVRKSYQGDRELTLRDNGMHEESMKQHSLITPKQNVYYSFNLLFPEALFSAMAIKTLIREKRPNSRRKSSDIWDKTYSQAMFLRDKAVIQMYCASIWEAFADVIGNEEADKVIKLYQKTDESYYQYISLYIDHLNVEYLETSIEKRTDKLRNIAKRIAKKPNAYYRLEEELNYWGKEFDTPVNNVEDTEIEYPEKIIW
ncbi:MAG: DUF6904 family protein [Lachnospiraceae bacterium]